MRIVSPLWMALALGFGLSAATMPTASADEPKEVKSGVTKKAAESEAKADEAKGKPSRPKAKPSKPKAKPTKPKPSGPKTRPRASPTR